MELAIIFGFSVVFYKIVNKALSAYVETFKGLMDGDEK